MTCLGRSPASGAGCRILAVGLSYKGHTDLPVVRPVVALPVGRSFAGSRVYVSIKPELVDEIL